MPNQVLVDINHNKGKKALKSSWFNVFCLVSIVDIIDSLLCVFLY